ncbi:DUF1295-domain-containing protein [Mytilinidion resinicola]|uniref:DUF1295-domain-containing protein n=1 Tax=Mytilinidion resinicola TaxID=574789 RepID=A0A6A6YTH8_9PEZI|nr:DUF1295-domain-containing protein [Mytilinidion resinicola]KAF2812110.1 DUF1295-domain-containing protein [Mytilinidion resinicola]
MPGLLNSLLAQTAFRNPLLRTVVPSVALAYGIQAAFAVPSIAAQSERFYDLSGSLTYLSCTAFSLSLPYLRARAAGAASGGLLEYLRAPAPGQGLWFWRQALLSAAVGIWATRLGTYLFKRISADGHDSRFDEIRRSPPKFFGAWMAQATWVSLCLMPVVAVNALPRSAFSLYRFKNVGDAFSVLPVAPFLTDAIGIGLFVFGLAFEIAADRQKSQWVQEKKEKKHSEEFLTRGLWGKSRHPNYFGEMTLWTGIAVAAGGLLVRYPAQVGLGLSGAFGGRATVLGMAAVSPAFVSFLLLKVSGIPLSENKYDKRYGDRKDYQHWKETTPMLFPKFW